MSEYLNATCHVCGRPYHKCMSCDKVKEFTPWRTIACSIECYKIFMAINRYTKKDITKEEAREVLEQYDFSNMEGYSQSVQRAVKEIMTVEDDNSEPMSVEIPKEPTSRKQNKKMRYKSGYYKSLSKKKESEDDNE